MPQETAIRRCIHLVREVRAGPATRFDRGRLAVDLEAAAAMVCAPVFAEVSVSIASPGDRTRIVNVLDAVEPRAKGRGSGRIFPGWLGPLGPPIPGSATHVLRGVAVVVAGHLPRAQEAIVDMSGSAAALSPLGSTHNIVIGFEPAPGADPSAVDAALRIGSLRLAAFLAEAATDAPPDAIEPVSAPEPMAPGDLPRIGLVTNLQTQGAFKDVFVYGRSLAHGLPTLIDPAELEDGAVVSGQYGHPALRNPTLLYQNHPIVAALRARDGRHCRFAGLVLSPEPVEDGAKRLAAHHAARVCRAAGFDAVVVTKEGGGNADADVALKMDALADLGIAAVGLFPEMAGPDGTGPSVVVPPAHPGGMVSTGNYDEPIALPAMERALGGSRINLVSADATDAVTVPVAVLVAALSPLGWGRLTCAEAA